MSESIVEKQQYGSLHIAQTAAPITQESSSPLIKELHTIDDTA